MRPTSVVIQAHKHISQLRRRWVEKSSAGWVKRCSRVVARRGPRGRRGCCRTRPYQRNGECWGFSPSTFLSDGCLYCWQLRSFIKLDCCNRYKSLRWLLGGLKVEKRALFFFFFLHNSLNFLNKVHYISTAPRGKLGWDLPHAGIPSSESFALFRGKCDYKRSGVVPFESRPVVAGPPAWWWISSSWLCYWMESEASAQALSAQGREATMAREVEPVDHWSEG